MKQVSHKVRIFCGGTILSSYQGKAMTAHPTLKGLMKASIQVQSKT